MAVNGVKIATGTGTLTQEIVEVAAQSMINNHGLNNVIYIPSVFNASSTKAPVPPTGWAMSNNWSTTISMPLSGFSLFDEPVRTTPEEEWNDTLKKMVDAPAEV